MTPLSSPSLARQRVPRLIGWLFGGLWALIATMAFPLPWRRVAGVLALAAAVAFLVRIWRLPAQRSPGRPFFRTGAYLASVALEIVAIQLAASILPRHGLTAYIYCAVGVIVGLHFIGLWKASGSRRFLTITAGMCAVSLVAALLPTALPGIDPREALLGLGNALVLWLGAAVAD